MNKATSEQKSDEDRVQDKVPTADGTRIEFDELNVGRPDQQTGATGSWFRRFRAKLSLFLAGMYTGVGCSGVPHAHHTYGHDRDHGPI